MAGGDTTLKVVIVGDSKSGERALKNTESAAHGLGSKLASVGGMLGRAFATVAVAGATGAVAAGTWGVKIASANEQAQISFETMLGSATKAQKFLGDLKAFAAKTPFEFPELQTAASSLISAGVQASKVIPIMTTLGDVTSGMGTGSEGVKRATIALQQMNAAGRITGEDLNQLRDAGIPVYDLLAAATGKSKGKIVELAQAGKLGQKELGLMMKALESGKGLEKFNGLMEKQSQSLLGLWSSFKDTLGQGLATAVEPIIPLLKDGLGAATEYLASILPHVVEWMGKAAKTATSFFKSLKDGGGAGDGVSKTFKSITDTGKHLWAELQKLAPSFQKATGELPKMEPILQKTGDLFKWIADHSDLIAKALPFVVAAFVAVKAAQAANNLVGRDSAIGMGVQTATTLTLAASNFALSSAMRATTTAENVGILARVRARVVTIASTVAQGAAAAASGAWTAAQWLLNAALTANPIGLVVAAIALLVAGFIYAWKNSETFRNIVKGALEAVGKTAQYLWENWWRPAFKMILSSIGWVLDALGSFLDWIGNFPGMGWAKDAAKAVQGVSDKIKGMNSALDSIDLYKQVNIDVILTGSGAALMKKGGVVSSSKSAKVSAIVRGYAKGGTNIPAGLAWVGENGPELMNVPGGSTVYDAETSKRMARGGGRGPVAPLGAAGGTVAPVYVTVNVHGSVTAERDLARSIAGTVRDELVKSGRRNGAPVFV